MQLEDDPHALISLKTVRLGYLYIGPKIENLDTCSQAEDIYLQNNMIQHINQGFSGNPEVNNIHLGTNKIQHIQPMDLAPLKNLCVLNLSYNSLGEGIDAEHMQEYREELVTLFPGSLIVLNLEGNACAVNSNRGTEALVRYRKPFVLGLLHLESFDKVDV
jgi:hypothetical protein